MTTQRQRQAARRNIRKAQAAWKSMSHREHALAQPQGRSRRKPGAGGGRFYRVEVRPKDEFVTFRTQDVGEPGHVERLAGKRASGSWATKGWLISKEDAHVEGERLVADTKEAKGILEELGSDPIHVKGDVFRAKDRRNIPERSKPTTAQRRARSANIRKAQATRRHARRITGRRVLART